MNTDTKEKLNNAAKKAAVHAAEKAKVATGWRRWLWFAVAAGAAVVALFTTTGCAAAVRQDAGAISAHWVILPITTIEK